MQNNEVSARNIGCIIILMELSSLLMEGSGILAQDTWLAVLAGAVMAVPMFCLYARIAKLNTGRGLFDMLHFHFGKIGGGIFIALLSWYAVHIASLVTRNFSEFVSAISLNTTPKVVIMAGIIGVGGYLASCSYKVMGRWALIIFSSISINFIISFLMAFRSMDFNHIKPVFEHSWKEIASAGFRISAIAFSEIFLTLILFQALKKKESPYRAYGFALLVGALFLAASTLQNILVMGKNMTNASVFPSYIAARIIRPGIFIEHIESLISFGLILLGISKASITLHTADIGIKKLFGLKDDNHHALIPICMLALALCAINFNNIQDLMQFAAAYQYYAIPFTFLIPIVLWIKSELYVRKHPAPVQIKPDRRNN